MDERTLIVLVMLIVMVIHELGHCIIPFKQHRNPRIKLCWWGPYVTWDDYEDTLIIDLFNISICGIFTGALVLFAFYGSIPLWMYDIYIIGCVLDIWNLVICFILLITKGFDTKVKDQIKIKLPWGE